jgi:hypothetical protein
MSLPSDYNKSTFLPLPDQPASYHALGTQRRHLPVHEGLVYLEICDQGNTTAKGPFLGATYTKVSGQCEIPIREKIISLYTSDPSKVYDIQYTWTRCLEGEYTFDRDDAPSAIWRFLNEHNPAVRESIIRYRESNDTAQKYV